LVLERTTYHLPPITTKPLEVVVFHYRPRVVTGFSVTLPRTMPGPGAGNHRETRCPMNAPHVGLILALTVNGLAVSSYPDMAAVSRTAEGYGFDSVWLCDHFLTVSSR